MNAQQIINKCQTQKSNSKQFRKEVNIDWLTQDAIKQFKEKR